MERRLPLRHEVAGCQMLDRIRAIPNDECRLVGRTDLWIAEALSERATRMEAATGRWVER